MTTTRFAPSPTGHLHLGHLFAALVARSLASSPAHCLLRVEDIDTSRCRPHFLADLVTDLHLFGLDFPSPFLVQSSRFPVYSAALDQLRSLGLLYPCFCTRKSLAAQSANSPASPLSPPRDPSSSDASLPPIDAPHSPSRYSRHCRHLPDSTVQDLLASGTPHSWRIDMQAAAKITGALSWSDLHFGTSRFSPADLDDVILARKDCPASYHLAVTVDDAAQGVTLVTRGQDLIHATPVHRTLQCLLGLPTPSWYHHPLITDDLGKRLAKRDHATSLRQLLASGLSPDEILAQLRPFWPAILPPLPTP